MKIDDSQGLLKNGRKQKEVHIKTNKKDLRKNQKKISTPYVNNSQTQNGYLKLFTKLSTVSTLSCSHTILQILIAYK